MKKAITALAIIFLAVVFTGMDLTHALEAVRK